jgi:hypothetical protein
VPSHGLWYQDLDAHGLPWLDLLNTRGALYSADRSDRSRKQLLKQDEGEPIDGADEAVELANGSSK